MHSQLLSTLLAKQMDRREFLLHVGLVLLAVTGISSIVKIVTNPKGETPKTGFGAGPYGK